MADIKVPYLVTKMNKRRDRARHYWQPSAELEGKGWNTMRLPDELGAAIAAAKARNDELAAWRKGAPRVSDDVGTLRHGIRRYRDSHEFAELKPKSQRGYGMNLDTLEAWAGDRPVNAITTADVNVFYAALYWKDRKKQILRTPAKACAVVTMARILWKWLNANGLAASNPAREIQLSSRRGAPIIFPRTAVERFVEVADKMGHFSMGDAIVLNEWLGQRKMDVLTIPKSHYRNGGIYVRQDKTDARIKLPVDQVPRLAARIEQALARDKARTVTSTFLIVSEATGTAYKDEHARKVFAEIRDVVAKGSAELGIEPTPAFAFDDEIELDADQVATLDLDFMHLRHTAVTRLAAAGCTAAEIAAITGHSLATVETILDRYLVRTSAMAANAFLKRLTVERANGE